MGSRPLSSRERQRGGLRERAGGGGGAWVEAVDERPGILDGPASTSRAATMGREWTRGKGQEDEVVGLSHSWVSACGPVEQGVQEVTGGEREKSMEMRPWRRPPSETRKEAKAGEATSRRKRPEPKSSTTRHSNGEPIQNLSSSRMREQEGGARSPWVVTIQTGDGEKSSERGATGEHTREEKFSNTN